MRKRNLTNSGGEAQSGNAGEAAQEEEPLGRKVEKRDGYPHTHSDLTPGRTRLLALEKGEAGSPNAQGYRHMALLPQTGLSSTAHVSQQDVDKYLCYRNGS